MNEEKIIKKAMKEMMNEGVSLPPITPNFRYISERIIKLAREDERKKIWKRWQQRRREHFRMFRIGGFSLIMDIIEDFDTFLEELCGERDSRDETSSTVESVSRGSDGLATHLETLHSSGSKSVGGSHRAGRTTSIENPAGGETGTVPAKTKGVNEK